MAASAALTEALTQLGDGALLVGFSGGLDSSVLLHALAQQPHRSAYGLRAIHVHHGLHSDADAWAEHCAGVCRALSVALSVVRVTVASNAGHGLEAAARHVRHDAFYRELGEGEALVLAHHQDDQAETVLLRLMRASGMAGLGAMRPRRKFGRGELLRPLLSLPRSTLAAYAAGYGLNWLEDSSNADLGMDRNYLRHVVMPALLQRWPDAAAALSRSARLHAAQSAALARQAQRTLLAHSGSDPQRLSVSVLLALEDAERSEVLRQWVESLGLPALPGHAPAIILTQVLSATADSAARFSWAGCVIRRWRDGIHALGAGPATSSGWHAHWDGTAPLALPSGKILSFSDATGPGNAICAADDFEVRFRIGGERMLLPGRSHHRALKDLLRESGLPPWQRSQVPLLYAADGALLAAGDLFLSAAFTRYCQARGAQLQWQPRSTDALLD